MQSCEVWGEPTDYDTNPNSKTFFAGASFEHKARVLQRVAPKKFKAISTRLDAALRKAFLTMGPDQAAAAILVVARRERIDST